MNILLMNRIKQSKVYGLILVKLFFRSWLGGYSLFALLSLLWLTPAWADNPVVNLNVGYKTVNFTGKSVQAIAVNDQVPGPTLHFKEGDHVTINVYNHLKVGTTIHWHGILVPWTMDGVAGVSQKPIPPGGVFHYQFTLYQSGTYWYHAHDNLEEQQGLYGAFIIDPKHPTPYRYTKDKVVILSDWSNTDPNQIYANLKKDGDYYSSQFPLQPSLARYLHDYYTTTSSSQRKQLTDAYLMMQQMRMSIYDLSDVAYDTFLLNGHPPSNPWQAQVKVGDVVRLRVINASGSTIFHVKIPNATMEVVHVQGNDVRPYTVNEFTVAPAETVDVLVRIKKSIPYIIYAESLDTSSAAVGALVTAKDQIVDYKAVKPFPIPAPVMVMGHNMSGMEKMAGMGSSSSMNMTGHNMPTMSKQPANAETPMMPSMSNMKSSSTNQPMPTTHNMTDMASPATSPVMNIAQSKTTKKNNLEAVSSSTKTIASNNMSDTTGQTTISAAMSASMTTIAGASTNQPMPMNHDKANMLTPMANPRPAMNMTTPGKTVAVTNRNSVTPASSSMPMSHNMTNMPATTINPPTAMKTKMSTTATKGNSPLSSPTSISTTASGKMEHASMGQSVGQNGTDTSSYQTTGTAYQNLEAVVKTNDPNISVHVIKMVLSGYMGKYIWFMNGVPEYRAKPILFVPGQRYRFIFINETMMNHPMHMHGHWFILRNGHGAYDPLLHTINVPPGATAVADVDADASGQWYFHCHNLYHMMAGMANLVRYTPPSPSSPLSHNSTTAYQNVHPTLGTYYTVPGTETMTTQTPTKAISSNSVANTTIIPDYLSGGHGSHFTFANLLNIDTNFYNTGTLTYKGLFGPDYNKLELFTNDAEFVSGKVENADMDIFYWHNISQFWAIKGGLNTVYRPAQTPYVQPGIGLEGIMPFFIETDVRSYYHDGSAKLDVELSRKTQLLNRLFLETTVRGIVASKTVSQDEIGSGLDETQFLIGPAWQFSPALAFYTVFESTNYYGATKSVRAVNGDDVHENIVKAGISLLF